MKKYLILLNILAFITLIVVINAKKQTMPTVQYFPIDPLSTFDYADTTLKLIDYNYPYKLLWESKSKTNKSLYLRQDVSILYENGKLQGVKSKWEENKQEIILNETIQGKTNSLFEVVTFHHGEVHYNKYIKSVQDMSHNHLFVIEQNNAKFAAYKSQFPTGQANAVKKLDKQIKKRLLSHWHELLNHFQIKSEDYTIIPLTDLNKKLRNDDLPLPKANSTQIIGQLWEGLYKNYVLPTTKSNQDSYIPIILFSKDQSHLLVLFSIGSHYEKLIQTYPK